LLILTKWEIGAVAMDACFNLSVAWDMVLLQVRFVALCRGEDVAAGKYVGAVDVFGKNMI
jgi:hypothetical protein